MAAVEPKGRQQALNKSPCVICRATNESGRLLRLTHDT